MLDFTRNPMDNFRENTHKVLPLVYDESLSYYEQICKIRAYQDYLAEQIETQFSDTLAQFFNSIMPNVIYDETDEKITLSFVSSSNTAVNTYTPGNDTQNIL